MPEKTPHPHFIDGAPPVAGKVEFVTPAQEQLAADRESVASLHEAEGDKGADEIIGSIIGGVLEGGGDSAVADAMVIGAVESEVSTLKPPESLTLRSMNKVCDEKPEVCRDSLAAAKKGGVDLGRVTERMDAARPWWTAANDAAERSRRMRIDFAHSVSGGLLDLADEELQQQQAEINSVIQTSLESNLLMSGDEKEESLVFSACQLLEKVTESNMADWPSALVKSPDSVDPRIRSMLESSNGTVYFCARAAWNRYQEQGNRVLRGFSEGSMVSAEQNIDLQACLFDCLRITLGSDEGAKRIQSSYYQSITEHAAVDIPDAKWPILTDYGASYCLDQVHSVETIGRQGALALHDYFGVTNFGRWNPGVLKKAVGLVNGEPLEGEWSIALMGRNGDHNGFLADFKNLEEAIIPIEVESSVDMPDRVKSLRSLGVDAVRRVSVFGHGGQEGLRLSWDYVLPRDASVLATDQLREMVKLIRKNDDGLRELNLISCSGAKSSWGDNKGSLAENISLAYYGVAVNAAPGILYMPEHDSGTLTPAVMPESLNRPLDQIIPRFLTDKVRSRVRATLWNILLRPRIDTVVDGRRVQRDNSAKLTIGGI